MQFYGQFNSILSLLGKCSNEMAAVHLTKTYCLPTLTYGCEILTLTDNSLHTISVAWNNRFRRIFKCCWRESTKPLQFFCKTVSIAHLIDQRKMIFLAKVSQSKSSVLKTLAYLKRNQCNALRPKYGLCPYDGTHAIKRIRYSKIFPLLSRCDFMFF